MSSQKKFKGGNKDDGLWLLSFADLSCILISFFILLLSYSKIEQDKFDKVKEQTNKKAPKTPTDSLDAVSKQLEKKIEEMKLKDKVKVLYDMDGVTIEFKDNLLFKTASADSNPNVENILDPVLKLLYKTNERYHITLEGHTDDRPIKKEFKSNWELSAARGITLLNIAKKKGIPENRISVQAYAHTRPKVPIAGLKGKVLEEARTTNRRVVIRLN